MFRKGSQIRVSSASGLHRLELQAEVKSDRPLRVELTEGDASLIRPGSTGKAYVDLLNVDSGEVLMTAAVEKYENDNVLVLKGLGTREMRKYVRVNAWISLRYRVTTAPDEEAVEESDLLPDFGQPLKELDRTDLKRLARTDEASEAVLYLLQAVQSIDRKIEALARLIQNSQDTGEQDKQVRQRVNISGSGLRFESDTPFDHGTYLSMRFRLPMARPVEIMATGEVVRVDTVLDEATGKDRYCIACHFLGIRESDREKVVTFAVQKQREALRRMRAAAIGF